MDIITGISIYCVKVSKNDSNLDVVHVKVSTPEYYELAIFHHTITMLHVSTLAF